MEPNYRRCISCHKVAHRDELWRVVRDHTHQTITLDQGMGRSAYLCPNAACLQTARRKNRLGRALKAPVPEAVYATLAQRLAETAELSS
jgi:predicted RNA-binding protein YlxR (DUF448 family)